MIGACWFGYNAPGCFLWADVLPNGRVYVRLDYKFQHATVESAALEIQSRTRSLESKLTATYAPPEMFPKPKDLKSETRHIIEAESPAETFARYGLPMYPAGSNHAHGWQRIHDYLRNAPDGQPWLMIAPACRALIRTLPSLVQSKTDPDDVAGDDYAAHALRVLLSSRPHPSVLETRKKPYAFGTIGWLRERDKKAPGVLAR